MAAALMVSASFSLLVSAPLLSTRAVAEAGRCVVWMGLSRRAALSFLPAFSSLPAAGADRFEFVDNGSSRQLTEMEAREALSRKVNAATEAGKGIDEGRRGKFNEKALFSEDFYFKYGLRPTPAEVIKSPYLPPQAELPFSPIQRRYTGYQKYAQRITAGVNAYSGELREAISAGQWDTVAVLLEKGSKGRGSNSKGEGTGTPASDLRSACRALGLFANTALQSENDNGTTTANLLARHLINELYFSMDDIAAAAEAGDSDAAKEAWARGKDYLNGYLNIVNQPITSKVGDRFAIVSASF